MTKIIDNIDPTASIDEETQYRLGNHSWALLVNLIQDIFSSEEIPGKMRWETLVLIPKDKEKYRGIGFLDLVWKLIISIINHRIVEKIEFHKSFHGFRENQGTGKAILEDNIMVSLEEKGNRTLYQAYIELSKVYD